MKKREKPVASWKVSEREASGYVLSVAMVTVIVIAFLCAWVRDQIADDYDRTYTEASRETMNLVRALEAHVRESISNAEDELQTLKALYERYGENTEAYADFQQHLRLKSGYNMYSVLNAQGDATISAMPLSGLPNYAFREFFIFHRDHADSNLNIGKPIKGLVTGENVIPLSLRINHPDGSFAGVAYIGLRSDTFSDFYQDMELGDDKLVSVTGMDGVVRARQVKNVLEVGQNVVAGDLRQRALKAKQGTFFSQSIVDNTVRVRSYQVMPDYPLIISVGVSAETVFAPYEKRKQIYIAGLLLISVCLLALSIFLIKRINQVIREKENRYHAIIAAMAEGVLLFDANGLICACNGSAEKILGLTAEQLLGKPSFYPGWSIVDENGQPIDNDHSPVVLALQSGDSAEKIIGLQQTGGVQLWLYITFTPLFWAKKKEAYGVVVTFTDITERKRIESALNESRERFEALIKQSSEAVVVYDVATMGIVEVNNASAVMFGYPEEELLTKTLADIVAYSVEERNRIVDQLLTQGKFPSGIGQYLHKGGRRFLAERTGSLINFQGKKLVLVSHRDISQERKLREDIKREVEIAGTVQKTMLPSDEEQEYLSIRTVFEPLHIVSGDYFGYQVSGDQRKLRGYLIDVTGHGMATALHTSAISVLMHKEMELETTWSVGALRRLNRQFMKMLPEETFVAMIVFDVDLSRREIACWSGGINEFYTLTAGSMERVILPGSLMGILADTDIEINSVTIPIQKGDTFYFMTDGITEWMSARAMSPCNSFEQTMSRIKEMATSKTRHDDCAAICIRINDIPE
ncbi:MAG TPA: PAS domain S-box protein [Patescibacteria group bacterium]|nr:PAS domain S-box protein [Patescibacteria group bacterium]